MRLSGNQHMALCEALMDAFNPSTLARMVRWKLDENLANIVLMSDIADGAYKLVAWCEESNRVEDLIIGACAFIPGNIALQDIKKRSDDEKWFTRIEDAIRIMCPNDASIEFKNGLSNLAKTLRNSKQNGLLLATIATPNVRSVLHAIKEMSLSAEGYQIAFSGGDPHFDIKMKDLYTGESFMIKFCDGTNALAFERENGISNVSIGSRLSKWKVVHTSVQNLFFSLDSFETALERVEQYPTDAIISSLKEIWDQNCKARVTYVRTLSSKFTYTINPLEELNTFLDSEQDIDHCILKLRIGDEQGVRMLRNSFDSLKPMLQQILTVADLHIIQIADELQGK